MVRGRYLAFTFAWLITGCSDPATDEDAGGRDASARDSESPQDTPPVDARGADAPSDAHRDTREFDGGPPVDAPPADVAPGDVGGGGERGHIIAVGQKWAWSRGDAFVPQLAMVGSPHVYWDNGEVDEDAIARDVETHLVRGGLNGFHIPVFCEWWDIDADAGRCTNAMDGPDDRTFRVLEAFIQAAYEAGGMVHLWMYGDSARGQNPVATFGLGSDVEERVLAQIAARLGPLPGWTMGYGFDLFEWSTSAEIEAWRDYLQARMDPPHLLGARGSTNQYQPEWSEELEYFSVEWHRPTYDDYVDHLAEANGRPAFSEDRFRRRPSQNRPKDYNDPNDVRRGLWYSMLAGGVATIWGNLDGANGANEGDASSLEFSNSEQIRTQRRFWQGRFSRDMQVCGRFCIENEEIQVRYGEDTSQISTEDAIAVDTRVAYEEIMIQGGTLPYASDWAIVISRP